ncbi:MAG: hypothetical protein AB4372_11955 [Xenococcus sp. (in: cyanobacteria)]
MSQKDRFGSGFVLGSIIGGIVGGLLGASLVNYRDQQSKQEEGKPLSEGGEPVKFTTEESIEVARHRLEDKIAQLNLAIDDVRQQLETVNGNSTEVDS